MKKVILTSRISYSKKELYKNKGIRIISIPMIRVEIVKNKRDIDKIIKIAFESDYIIFSSKWSVHSVFSNFSVGQLEKIKEKLKSEKLKIFCTGKSTYLVVIDYLSCKKSLLYPNEFSSDGILQMLSKEKKEGKNFFLPKSDIGSLKVIEYIQKNKGYAKIIVSYFTKKLADVLSDKRKNQIKKMIEMINPQTIAFTSPSNWNSFYSLMKRSNLIDNMDRILSIGHVTTQEILSYGIDPNKIVTADEYSIPGLLKTIEIKDN